MKLSEIFRSRPATGSPRFNKRMIDRESGTVIETTGTVHRLRPQSFRVLDHLADRAGEIVSKDDLFTAVWPDTAVTDDSLTQCIGEIRRALGDDERRVLETIHRMGFRLHPDRARPRTAAAQLAIAAGVCLAAVLVTGGLWRDRDPSEHVPRISIATGEGADALAAEVGAALDRFGSVRRMSDDARFVLSLERPSEGRFLAELTDTASKAVLLTQSIPTAEAVEETGSRLARRIASPTSGAIATTLIRTALGKPLDLLTPFECYLHVYQSGPEEMLRRAEACLGELIEADPDNARAQALLGDVYATQYWYGIGLDGPARDDRALRTPLAARVLDTVRAAEAAGLPDDATIHLAIGRSYYANCKRDHMTAALRRAAELNPHEPEILGAAGNYLAYAGDWETGVALARQAIAMAEEDAERWWYWPIGKEAWLRGDYEAALDAFMRGYMEDDWHTQLHLAYTLPFLGRMDEARQQATRLREVYPGFTRADARETHRRWCFEPAFIERMDQALAMAGLPDAPDDTPDQPNAALGIAQRR